MNLQMSQPDMGLRQASRPYVAFERRAVEYRDANGMVGVREVDFVKITPMGSKDIFEKIVTDWLSQLVEKVKMGIETLDNQMYYNKLYEYWKKGEELPVEGTPIKAWPLATPAEQAKCVQIHILTVEALAQCNQECITRLGMGGQMLRNRANEWLQTKNDTGPIVARAEAQQATIDNLLKRLEALEAENRVLKDMKGLAQVQFAPAVPAPSSMERLLDIPDESDPNLVGDALEDAMESITTGAEGRAENLILNNL